MNTKSLARSATAYSDNTVLVVDTIGRTLFTGYYGLLADERLILVGVDSLGSQYAFSGGYTMGLTRDGDVFLGRGDHKYTYDYDDEGNFHSLTDNAGNEYAIETDEDGDIFITDAAGNKGEFYADGTYTLFDEAGSVFKEGELYGDGDVDDFDTSDDSGYDDTGYDDSGYDDTSSDDSGD